MGAQEVTRDDEGLDEILLVTGSLLCRWKPHNTKFNLNHIGNFGSGSTPDSLTA